MSLCTGSTLLFKLITYVIMEKLEERERGHKNGLFTISSLFFADDGLIFSGNIETAMEIIQILTEISNECGLELNKDKSNIIIFNMKERDQPHEIEGIIVVKQIKYLGVLIDNKRKLFKSQRKIMLEKAFRSANYDILSNWEISK